MLIKTKDGDVANANTLGINVMEKTSDGVVKCHRVKSGVLITPPSLSSLKFKDGFDGVCVYCKDVADITCEEFTKAFPTTVHCKDLSIWDFTKGVTTYKDAYIPMDEIMRADREGDMVKISLNECSHRPFSVYIKNFDIDKTYPFLIDENGEFQKR